MTQTRFKKVPFDIELAKKIAKGEMKGRIVTHEGREVRIVCWDKKPIEEYPIVVLAKNDHVGEMLYTCTEEGFVIHNYKNIYNLILEIPTHYKDYSNFVPQKRQPCLVRDHQDEQWDIAVCAGRNKVGDVVFYEYRCTYQHFLPLNKMTERLLGTSKSYEELIKELDEEM